MKKLLFTLFILAPFISFAQHVMTPNQYTQKYKDIAIKKMKQDGIPASITLAQGMLESGYGASRLAVKGNNHFGIKCGGDWRGAKIYHSDDSHNDCFRKYRSVEQSYDDHSKFLTSSKRYSQLFELSSSDYKGWAKGLKSAGYATANNYAELLIGIIEKNDLHKYDTPSKGYNKPQNNNQNIVDQMGNGDRLQHMEMENNGVKFIKANYGDTWSSLSKEYKISLSRLLRINDLTASIPIKPGDYIYLKSKKWKSKTTLHHTVQSGETRRSVAQKYGITESSLRRMNRFAKTRELTTGDIVRLK